MLDIKVHTLHGKEFHVFRGPILIPAIFGVTALTAASFYLNGVFAFAISVPGKPKIRPAFAQANRHMRTILAWGLRHRARPVVLRADLDALGAVVLRRQPEHRRGDHDALLSAGPGPHGRHRHQEGHVAGATSWPRRRWAARSGAVVCSPPYMLGRLGILMLGWHELFWLGVILIVIGAALQTGVTSAVKAVKFSAKLIGNPDARLEPTPPA